MDRRSSLSVSKKVPTASEGFIFSKAAETMEANKIAVPTAPRKSILNTAAYGAGSLTMGAAFCTKLCSIGQSNLMVATPKASLTPLIVHTLTKTVRMAKGDQALMICPAVYSPALRSDGFFMPLKVKISLGCHFFRKADRQTRLTNAEVTSGNSGPMKLAVMNWVVAKDTPATNTAGQVWRMPRIPSIMATNQKGTIIDRIGSWRPAT